MWMWMWMVVEENEWKKKGKGKRTYWVNADGGRCGMAEMLTQQVLGL